MAKNIFTDQFSEALHGAQAARIDIHAGDGNLAIDHQVDDGQALASGTLQYLEGQGMPTRTRSALGSQTVLALHGGKAKQPWFHLPWAACNGATEWHIHLNPTVSADIKAHSDGGNLQLDLEHMLVTRVSADTGGGNIDLVLPDNINNLDVTAKTGAGNVTISLPGDVATRIHATTGLGKAIINPRFTKTGKDTYQSAGFEQAANKVEITAGSGAGNVSINVR